jgi:hypothetical protein
VTSDYRLEEELALMRALFGCLLIIGLLNGGPLFAQTPVHQPPASISCPGDLVVWVNTRSGIFHFKGERYFGSTQVGKFMCEKAALDEGDRPTRNGQ